MQKKMKTAKALGYAKGDFVMSGPFPAIIIADVNRSTPCLEVWGIYQESGSAYAHDLRPIDYPTFIMHVRGNHPLPLTPYSDVSKKAIRDAQSALAGV